MIKVIVHCDCGDMDRFSRDAFHILYPNEELPPVYGGRARIREYAQSLPDSNFSRYLMQIHRSRFAFYFEVDDDGNVIKQINLKTGARVC